MGPNGPEPARPLMPDKGFEGNPGKEFWSPDLSKYPEILRQKLETVIEQPQFIRWRATSLDDAKNIALELGTSAEYETVPMGNYVNAGLIEARMLGVGIPRAVRVDPKAFTGEGEDGVMAYLAGEDVLLLNPAVSVKDAKAMAKRHGASRYWSSSNDMHAIRHEVGHSMLYHASPMRYIRLHRATALNSRIRSLVAKEVSGYAAESPLELVAEIYAGMRAGKTYSPKIMRLYRAYGGQ